MGFTYLSLLETTFIYQKQSNNGILLILFKLMPKRQGTDSTFYHINYPVP